MAATSASGSSSEAITGWAPASSAGRSCALRTMTVSSWPWASAWRAIWRPMLPVEPTRAIFMAGLRGAAWGGNGATLGRCSRSKNSV
ncbi:hypothetical protein G6F60_015595 [Rhizopus arrhizus]|nr:hypothetical protein G6F60_015595 [Rhizopus arrhizus]